MAGPVAEGQLLPMASCPADDAISFINSGAMLRKLEEGSAFGTVQKRVDTHAAHVFLTADRAWKLKRPVRYEYLDFSTPELRRQALERELALNRRTAPELYLAVHRLTADVSGDLNVDGSGETIDWVLEMHRFPDGAVLSDVARAGDLSPELVQAMADEVAGFHASAAHATGSGAERLTRVLDGNAVSLAQASLDVASGTLERLVARQREELRRHAALLDARAPGGRVRRGHGDLHRGNIAVLEGRPVLFDCLEFSDELATTDVLYDLAFLAMDLLHAGDARAASMLANRYCDVSGEDESGWALFPLFMSMRATIRAHVRAAAGDEQEALGYLRLASELLVEAPVRLIAIGGASGTGKSTLAGRIAPMIGGPPGARVLRSDVLRKRKAGVPPETRLAASSYTPQSSRAVYDHLQDLAQAHLRRGSSVILDAAFLDDAERKTAEALASANGLRLTGIWLTADEHDRIRRLNARSGDASDADARVAAAQSRRLDQLPAWSILDAGRPLETVEREAQDLIRGGAPC